MSTHLAFPETPRAVRSRSCRLRACRRPQARDAALSALGPVALTLLALLCLTGCKAGDGPADVWPPRFDAFAFGSDLVVVYPGTCRTVDFTFDTSPPTRAADLELEVDGGSMVVHTVSPLGNLTHEGSRGEGNAVWRICAGLDAPEDGVIRVRYREHPDYFAETQLVQRRFLERLPASDAIVTLPLTGTYPTDVRWWPDGDVVEVVDRTGLVLTVDGATGIILRTEQTPTGDAAFLNGTHLLTRDNDWLRVGLIDRAERLLLSEVALWEFSDGSGEPGEIVAAHGARSTIATAGARRPAPDNAPVFVSVYDLDAKAEDMLVYRFPVGATGPNYPHVVVSPNGRRVAWTGLQVQNGSRSIGWDRYEPSLDLSNEIFDLDTGVGCSFEGTVTPPFREMSVDTDEPIIARPAFSSDGAWLAHWASSDVLFGRRDYPLYVYDAATCGVRASTKDTPPNFHRASVAVAAGGDLLAAVSEDEVHLYDVPPGPSGALQRRVVLPAIETPDLHAGTQSAGFSDRVRLQRWHYQYPGLAFSDDGRLLASANTRGVRIYDLDDDLAVAQTPVVDPDDIEAFGPWFRVGVADDDDSPGGDLIYGVGPVSGFVYQLAPDEVFGGIDQYGVLYSSVDGIWRARNLTTGAVELLTAEEPLWQPALQNATVVVTDDRVELRR